MNVTMVRFCVLLTASALLAGSWSANAAERAALEQRLHNAEAISSLDDPDLKPWHLKLSVQLFNAKGEKSERGTIEEWWAGTGVRRVYTFPSYTSAGIMRDNESYRSTGKPAPPYVLGLLLNQLVHPLRTTSAARVWVPNFRTEKLGNVKLDCIMLDASTKGASQPLGTFPTYCLDPDTDRLRVSFDLGVESVARERLGTFQGRTVPLDISIAFNNIKAAEGHVEALSDMTPDEHLFDTDSSFEVQSAVELGPTDLASLIISKAQPVFPEDAKRNHTSGTVLMRARIGTNGHIERLDLLSAPSESLGVSALTAARQWTYKPYLVNGVARPVETTIGVHFNFGD